MLALALEVIALSLAIAALLCQPRRDSSAPPSWSNLSRAGRLILALIIVASIGKAGKSVLDGRASREASERQSSEIEELRSTNSRLLKVMSVSGGYNALVHGIVTFDRDTSGNQVMEALRNLFLKYASIEIEALNEFGRHRGRIDYGAHPEVRKYLSVTRMDDEPIVQARIPPSDRDRSFYFEIRVPNLRILNSDNIQYVRFPDDSGPTARVDTFPEMWRDFQGLYHVKNLFVDALSIEELGFVRVEPFSPTARR